MHATDVQLVCAVRFDTAVEQVLFGCTATRQHPSIEPVIGFQQCCGL